MFLGSFKTYFSGKNRLILPRRFRKELGNEDKFYILLGENGEIWGFDPENWLKLTESILKVPLSMEKGRVKRLMFFPKAEECVLDGQGRFILPQEFMENLNFKKEVFILGAGDHFEVWDLNLWGKQKARLEK
ncbi:hypothetical protein A3C26_01495 [Candidatus Daviesbacteria bacterium RIFCSPHIGHO2_02_FULL_39_12]|uniref:Transcriptional regulator MraZ n=2 Tax=Candidatus Daviesiibacteriota TaxID=1752718 RepID=A0A1F5JC58_9BACT|nr:MAG: hypothetical protein A3C26_01495 [Candidatus Daviesbacteria bacterium RIFCSPHIGHO2_02_FULL_39_12]OGE72034.1 MAG: hypothetical protein A3H40_00645 [Candidatus Daviesbacteria bacterium RIFCSPLOWO2_02_FULL_38_15]